MVKTNFRPIHQFAAYLSQIPSHEFTIEDNAIIGKSRIKSRSFPSFTIRYLKNGEISLKPSTGRAIRYTEEEELVRDLGSMAQTQFLTE